MALAYRESLPEGEPRGTLLCVHGFPQSSYMWRHLIDAAAEAGWRGIAPDLPGYGDSPYEGDGSWEAHVAALDAFHREHDLGPVVPVVHDWGGLIGLRWAFQRREAIRALVISDTGFFPDAKWHAMARTLRTPGDGERLIEGWTPEAMGQALKAISSGMDERSLAEYGKALATPERRRGVLELYRSGDFRKIEGYDLRTLDVPALVLWGEEDPFAPLSGARRFVDELPDAELVVVEGTSHFVYDDAPEACAHAVLRFLARV